MARAEPTAGRPGTLGMGLTLLGGLAVLISIIALAWYDEPGGVDSVGRIDFGTLAAAADGPGLPAIVPAYFDWLAWVLLLAVITLGAFANLPTPAAPGLRVLGAVVGLGGAAATFWALQQYKSIGGEGTYALHHASWGVWGVLGGFLVAGVGAAIGPRAA